MERFCGENGIPILMRIPYDERIASLCARGIPLAREDPSWEGKFRELMAKVQDLVG